MTLTSLVGGVEFPELSGLPRVTPKNKTFKKPAGSSLEAHRTKRCLRGLKEPC